MNGSNFEQLFYKRPCDMMDSGIFPALRIAQNVESYPEFTNATVVLARRGYC